MATTDTYIESKSTKELRDFRIETARRYDSMTAEQIAAEQREAKRHFEEKGWAVRTRDPRTEPKN